MRAPAPRRETSGAARRDGARGGRRARATVLLALVALVAGCAGPGSTSSAGVGVANPGYVSGDGTITQWQPQERGTPVELSGRTFQGEDVDVARWRGDVVVVNFWYAACPPCRAEAPDLVALAREHADGRVRVLGVNGTDEVGTALAFERTFDVPYPSLDDADGRGVSAMQGAVPLRAVPTTVVLDTEGRIAARILGRTETSTLRALVGETLEEAAR